MHLFFLVELLMMYLASLSECTRSPGPPSSPLPPTRHDVYVAEPPGQHGSVDKFQALFIETGTHSQRSGIFLSTAQGITRMIHIEGNFPSFWGYSRRRIGSIAQSDVQKAIQFAFAIPNSGLTDSHGSRGLLHPSQLWVQRLEARLSTAGILSSEQPHVGQQTNASNRQRTASPEPQLQLGRHRERSPPNVARQETPLPRGRPRTPRQQRSMHEEEQWLEATDPARRLVTRPEQTDRHGRRFLEALQKEREDMHPRRG